MALWDSILGGVGSALGIAGGIYDIYQGYQSNQAMQNYMGLAAGSTEKQDAYVQEMLNRMKASYWPYEDLNIQYMTEDLKRLRPAYTDQLNYQTERMGEQLDQARNINPLLDRTELQVLNTLTKDPTQLRNEMMGQATTDVNLAYGNQRAQDIRAMGLSGINTNSGQFQNYINRMGQSEALANAAARTQSARQAEDLALSRQSAALNYAKGAELPSYGYNQSVTSPSILAGLGSATGAYTGLANMTNANAQNNYNGMGYLLNQLTNGLGGMMGTGQ